MKSFLDHLAPFLNRIPKPRPQGELLRKAIAEKSSVLYFPISFPIKSETETRNPDDKLIILWPHRWEHDKNPDLFFHTLFRLHEEQFPFHLVVLGQSYLEVPPVFTQAQEKLADSILHFGYAPSKDDYFNLLAKVDLVVSTADHEFFGVAMLEATYLGAYPLCPNRLSYPEIFPKCCLYSTEQQLYKRIRNYCKHPQLCRQQRRDLDIDFSKYSWPTLRPKFDVIFDFADS